ncbi:hypothetical protein OH76DRAFT_177444 [Lentinus brumalis]|uniref:Uncharacterized protein n=1 Tax=Lentinus brumalis TaxID=2498619 RepID=A0A371CNL9_9APHY|nr:hypothetical protein OH76DRAFT_177444 [Polyporus brumalis]
MKPKDAESSLQREPAEPPGRAIRASLLLRRGHFERVQVNHLGSSYSEQTEPCPSRRSRSLRVSEDRCLPACEGWERALSYRDRHSLRVISGRAACVNRCSRLWLALVVEKSIVAVRPCHRSVERCNFVDSTVPARNRNRTKGTQDLPEESHQSPPCELALEFRSSRKLNAGGILWTTTRLYRHRSSTSSNFILCLPWQIRTPLSAVRAVLI